MPGPRVLFISTLQKRFAVSSCPVSWGRSACPQLGDGRTLEMHPNTVSRAYAKLIDEGLVITAGAEGLASPPQRLASEKPGRLSGWAELVNRAEAYLLEALKGGQRCLGRSGSWLRPSDVGKRCAAGLHPGGSLHAKGAVLGIAADSRQKVLREPERKRLRRENFCEGFCENLCEGFCEKTSPKAAETAISSKLHFSGSHDLSVELRPFSERAEPGSGVHHRVYREPGGPHGAEIAARPILPARICGMKRPAPTTLPTFSVFSRTGRWCCSAWWNGSRV